MDRYGAATGSEKEYQNVLGLVVEVCSPPNLPQLNSDQDFGQESNLIPSLGQLERIFAGRPISRIQHCVTGYRSLEQHLKSSRTTASGALTV
eukprot:1774404-Rhodomonas_salina.1